MLRKVTVEQMLAATVDVVLVDGTEYKGCDYPESPFLDNENWFSFLVGDTIMTIPREQVKQAQFNLLPVTN